MCQPQFIIFQFGISSIFIFTFFCFLSSESPEAPSSRLSICLCQNEEMFHASHTYKQPYNIDLQIIHLHIYHSGSSGLTTLKNRVPTVSSISISILIESDAPKSPFCHASQWIRSLEISMMNGWSMPPFNNS